MRKERVGFAVCGSFCTHQQVLGELEKLVQLYETVIPITSENTAFTDTRFGTSDDLLERLEDLTGHEVLCDIQSVEPIGPRACWMCWSLPRPQEIPSPSWRQGSQTR